LSTWTHERARVASLTRSRTADDPELLNARSALRTAKFEADVRKLVDAAPPLTDEQRNRLALLLLGGDGHGTAA
jgi:hypothetical protein